MTEFQILRGTLQQLLEKIASSIGELLIMTDGEGLSEILCLSGSWKSYAIGFSQKYPAKLYGSHLQLLQETSESKKEPYRRRCLMRASRWKIETILSSTNASTANGSFCLLCLTSSSTESCFTCLTTETTFYCDASWKRVLATISSVCFRDCCSTSHKLLFNSRALGPYCCSCLLQWSRLEESASKLEFNLGCFGF